MEAKNLMEINSPHIGTMESISDYQKLYINNKIGEHIKTNDLKIRTREVLHVKIDRLDELWKLLEKKYDLYKVHSERVFIIDDNFLAELWLQYDSSHRGITLNIMSDSIDNSDKNIAAIKEYLKDIIVDEKAIEYTILQNDNYNINETYYMDTIDIDFNPLAMPFLKDIDKYINDFLNSKASVLILQGEPGTGKSTFIKYILSQMQEKRSKDSLNLNVLYSFDESIFLATEFFRKVIYEKYDLLVLEDMNQVLNKNACENANPIDKFLSVTDGLISKNRKIIITTNIESKSQLYPALIRPGRCFDVLKFRKLQGVEIDDLCDSCAKDLDLQIESINVSEFYAKCNEEQNSDLTRNQIGF